MQSMLQSGYLSVMEVQTRDELESELVRFTRQLEFQTFAAMAVIDHFVGESEFINVDNTPAGYRETFHEHHGGKKDPVMQHCKRKSVPIIWDQNTYVNSGQGDLWEHQARFGYRCGITLALHMPDGKHFVLGVDRDQPLPKDSGEVTRIAALLQLYAVHAHEAALRIMAPSPAATGLPALTPRELETLRWTMEGKTAWEIARILGIAENTATRHAHSASRKLGCMSKHHAVVKALRLGLIQ